MMVDRISRNKCSFKRLVVFIMIGKHERIVHYGMNYDVITFYYIDCSVVNRIYNIRSCDLINTFSLSCGLRHNVWYALILTQYFYYFSSHYSASVETTVRYLGDKPGDSIPYYSWQPKVSSSSSGRTNTTNVRSLSGSTRRPFTRKASTTGQTISSYKHRYKGSRLA